MHTPDNQGKILFEDPNTPQIFILYNRIIDVYNQFKSPQQKFLEIKENGMGMISNLLDIVNQMPLAVMSTNIIPDLVPTVKYYCNELYSLKEEDSEKPLPIITSIKEVEKFSDTETLFVPDNSSSLGQKSMIKAHDNSSNDQGIYNIIPTIELFALILSFKKIGANIYNMTDDSVKIRSEDIKIAKKAIKPLQDQDALKKELDEIKAELLECSIEESKDLTKKVEETQKMLTEIHKKKAKMNNFTIRDLTLQANKISDNLEILRSIKKQISNQKNL